MAHIALRPFYASRLASGAQLSLRPLSRLIRRALEAQRRRDLDRDAAHLLHQSGGRLTDSLEREIARRHLGL
jgi:hypothetical protein